MDNINLTLGEFAEWDGEGLSIQAAFQRFHEANPWVLTALEELTLDLLARGVFRVGIGNLWEVLRWQYSRSTYDPSGYKVNNNFRSRYVRLMIERHPSWDNVFETRRLRAS
jgi:hypothetical protein